MSFLASFGVVGVCRKEIFSKHVFMRYRIFDLISYTTQTKWNILCSIMRFTFRFNNELNEIFCNLWRILWVLISIECSLIEQSFVVELCMKLVEDNFLCKSRGEIWTGLHYNYSLFVKSHTDLLQFWYATLLTGILFWMIKRNVKPMHVVQNQITHHWFKCLGKCEAYCKIRHKLREVHGIPGVPRKV